MKISIIGAGSMAQAVTKLANKAGHEVMICNSRGPETLYELCTQLKCIAGTSVEAAEFGEVVLIAIPLWAYQALPVESLSGKIVVDLLNYFPGRDGNISELDNGEITTSERLAKHLKHSHVVKAINSITVEDLGTDARPAGSAARRALPIAGDDAESKKTVITLLDQLGFDAVDTGPLVDSWCFERFRPVYCVALDKITLEKTLAATTRDTKVPDGFWLHKRFPAKIEIP